LANFGRVFDLNDSFLVFRKLCVTNQCTLPETNSSLAGKIHHFDGYLPGKIGIFRGKLLVSGRFSLAQAIIYLKKFEMNCSSNSSQQKNLFQKAVCGKRYSRILPAYSAKTTMEAMEKKHPFPKGNYIYAHG